MPKHAENDSFPLLTYLDELVESLRDLAPKALKEYDGDAIHDARVATRRLKAAVDLMDPVISKRHRKPFARALRSLRRRLGEMRDLDVMIDHLGHLRKSPATAGAITWLEARLAEKRDAAREHATKGISAARILAQLGTWWGVRAEVEESREATDTLLADSLHLQLDAFCEQADALSGLRQLAEESPRDPHALRIAGKSLRYTLEMAAVEGRALPAGVLRTFKKIQESLGNWHDDVVLTERAIATSVDSLLAHHDAAMQRGVLTLAQSTLKSAEKNLDQVMQRWKKEGADIARTIRESFPLTKSLAPESNVTDSPENVESDSENHSATESAETA